MKEIKYNTRMFIEENGQVIIRVRWNQKKNEVAFSVGCYADPKKWDCGNQRAIYNTTHKVGDKTFKKEDTILFCDTLLGFVFSLFIPKTNHTLCLLL